ncbi:MAG: hypothetical protein P4L99_06140 [Chthoniobacter sp.]|nr:hypothetical protein [Chthoniobacter sp.]
MTLGIDTRKETPEIPPGLKAISGQFVAISEKTQIGVPIACSTMKTTNDYTWFPARCRASRLVATLMISMLVPGAQRLLAGPCEDAVKYHALWQQADARAAAMGGGGLFGLSQLGVITNYYNLWQKAEADCAALRARQAKGAAGSQTQGLGLPKTTHGGTPQPKPPVTPRPKLKGPLPTPAPTNAKKASASPTPFVHPYNERGYRPKPKKTTPAPTTGFAPAPGNNDAGKGDWSSIAEHQTFSRS